MKLLPAKDVDLSALVELFNAGFSDYLAPMQLDARGLREHVETNGIDLDCSRIAMEDRAVAFALIALRDAAGWVGGMGTVPSRRSCGLGEQVLLAGIEAARARGCRAVWLEVIDHNLPAIRLYQKLGFERVRDLLVWVLPPDAAPPPPLRSVAADVAHAWITRYRRTREPWQRADASVAAMCGRGRTVDGLLIERAGEVRAAALVANQEDHVTTLQLAALDVDAAATALRAAAGRDRSIRLANVPEDEPASIAMRDLGADLVARQHELLLRLEATEAGSS